jgi:hypothetical protein
MVTLSETSETMVHMYVYMCIDTAFAYHTDPPHYQPDGAFYFHSLQRWGGYNEFALDCPVYYRWE